MTNTVNPLQLDLIAHGASETLIEQIVRLLVARIDDKRLRNGVRMPSIRQFAAMHSVSCATVVQAYDRLVGRGYLESRRGAGFFVREHVPELSPLQGLSEQPNKTQMDVVWLVRSMFRQTPQQFMPGMGLLPNDWLDAGLLANALRMVSRQSQDSLMQYCVPHGYLPLRQQLQLKLEELEIAASTDQIVTTSGVTQGLDLVAREFTRPGDTIFVDDPAWFLMFGSFAAMGVNIVGIPRLVDGPDMQQLAALAQVHRPKLFVINSVLHNPTSTSLTAAKAFQLLQIAQQFDFHIVEDDIYCDMHPG
ncbi:MAG: PLP-dependent aminotransferase family protein, partial [Burkholderiales bacterium]|nr:PLP-dependent aminotransferase family protein [Burkholderiales bacterium]